MNIKLIFNRFRICKRNKFMILFAFWVIGLVTGIIFAILFRLGSAPILNAAKETIRQPYFVLFVNILPIVLIAVAIHNHCRMFCLPLLFLEALCHGFCGMLPAFPFGDGAWLVRFFLLFSASCVSVVMWWLLLRHLSCNENSFSNDVLLACVLVCAVSLVDIYFISPQFSNLFINF